MFFTSAVTKLILAFAIYIRKVFSHLLHENLNTKIYCYLSTKKLLGAQLSSRCFFYENASLL